MTVEYQHPSILALSLAAAIGVLWKWEAALHGATSARIERLRAILEGLMPPSLEGKP
jgi:hypothetical protein